jgi:hypothetical protein
MLQYDAVLQYNALVRWCGTMQWCRRHTRGQLSAKECPRSTVAGLTREHCAFNSALSVGWRSSWLMAESMVR